ncbi:hypothetical protein Plhal703r1_c18g0081831 [Plasmopara halstedii]
MSSFSIYFAFCALPNMMMLMRESAPFCADLKSDATSISLTEGSDLLGLSYPPADPQHPLQFIHKTKAEEADATGNGIVRGHSSLPYQQRQLQHSRSSVCQYEYANLSNSSATYPLRPSLHYSDSSGNKSIRPYPYEVHAREPNMAFKRRRCTISGSSNCKRCRIVNCGKISVSRGLCRGHGGGRRCQHADCTKGAQSRSEFCWAHGGGQRCEVKCCMRSRKSKRFCVAHLNWETTAVAPTTPTCSHLEALPVRMQLLTPVGLNKISPASSTALKGSPSLPSLLQALRNTKSYMTKMD